MIDEHETTHIDERAWARLVSILPEAVARTQTYTHSARGAGKSWLRWTILFRDRLWLSPEQELRAACEWAVNDTGKPPGKISVKPRVFPGCSSGRDVA